MGKRNKKRKRDDDDLLDDEFEDELDDEDVEDDREDDIDDDDDGPLAEKPSKMMQMRRNLGVGPSRPGEQDILKSPMVLSLIGGCAVLLILGGVFWFMMKREEAGKMYQLAADQMTGGKYKQAIEGYNAFLEFYPKHPDFSDKARLERGRCEILVHIDGSRPDWEKGYEVLHEYTRTYRDMGEKYAEQKPELAKYAYKIGKGSAETAGRTFERLLLGVSDLAKTKLASLSNKEDPPTAKLAEIVNARETALAAIDKHEAYIKATDAIEAHLSADRPIEAMEAHRRILQRYPDLEKDKKLRTLVAEMLKAEQSLVKAADGLPRAGQPGDPAVPPGIAKPITLTYHTRASSATVSDGQRVFALAKDCVYGIDTVTGDPVWRQVIGLDTPFFPQMVASAQPGLLLFNTRVSELQLLDRETGAAIWRQPMEHLANGLPLIFQGQVYLAAQGGHLYRINLEDGTVTARLSFSQDIVPTPVLTHDEKNIVVLGSYGVAYTLSLRPLECKMVTFLGHARGAVNVPVTAMGTLLLIVENHEGNQGILHVVKAGEDGMALEEVGEASVPGRVRDAPILRGATLFVPSGGNRVTAFTVTDESEENQVTQIDVQSLEIDHKGPVHLLAGPNGRLWMSSNALHKFDLLADRLLHDTNQSAVGLATQPLQTANRQLFVGRRSPFCDAVYFTQNDGATLTGSWRTTLGSGVLQLLSSPPAYVIAVSETGEIFRMNAAEIARGGFKYQAQSRLSNMPDELVDPLQATVLSNGQIAAYCGNPSPKIWFINNAGQQLQTKSLDKPVAAPPVTLKAGIAVPMEDRIALLGGFFTGGAKLEPYRAPVGVEGFRWVSVQPLNEDTLIVVTNQQKLHKVQFRSSPVAALQATAEIPLDAAVDYQVQVHNGRVLFADASGTLKALDGTSLDVVSTVKLGSPVSNDLWVVGDQLFVETRDRHLHCFDLGQQLAKKWSIPLQGSGLAGSPLAAPNGALIVAQQDGKIWVAAADGKLSGQKLDLQQQLVSGPRKVGNWTFVSALDGTLHRVDSILQTAADPAAGGPARGE